LGKRDDHKKIATEILPVVQNDGLGVERSLDVRGRVLRALRRQAVARPTAATRLTEMVGPGRAGADWLAKSD